MLRAVATVSGLTLASRVTGLVREVLLARIFGVSAETDAFNVAFRLPNLLRRMFAEGAFQQAFIPMLADVRRRDESGTAEFIGRMTSALFWVLLGVSVLGHTMSLVEEVVLVGVLGIAFIGAAVWRFGHQE